VRSSSTRPCSSAHARYNGLDFRRGGSLEYARVPHSRLLLSLVHGMGHRRERFGNPNFCGDGVLSNRT
jgi:hypothetical protein